MVLYYAFGDGLGHLTRASAVMYTIGYQNDNFIILTSSLFANLIFKEDNIIYLSEDVNSNPEILKARVESIVKVYHISIIYIDSFPAGINGELNNLKIANCSLIYVARLLNWKNYSPCLNNLNFKFDLTYIVERLSVEQLEFIDNHSIKIQQLELKYPPQNNLNNYDEVLSGIESGFWLIVHSGNLEELEILFKYAQELAEIEKVDPFYLLISQVEMQLNSKKVKIIKYYPAYAFFPLASKIFTACGFNAISQTYKFVEKHYFIPFNRRFDDQFIRARNRKSVVKQLLNEL